MYYTCLSFYDLVFVYVLYIWVCKERFQSRAVFTLCVYCSYVNIMLRTSIVSILPGMTPSSTFYRIKTSTP